MSGPEIDRKTPPATLIRLGTGAPAVTSEDEMQGREASVDLRERAVTRREAAVGAQEGAAETKSTLEALRNAQLREANENLVVAALKAQALTEAAEQAGRLKEEFLAMLAHELRNPLSPILNAVAILKRISHVHPQLSWVHDVIERQADHMGRLLDDLLDVARVTGGKIELNKKPVTVAEFVRQAAETSRPLIDSRGQQLVLEMPDEQVFVDGDAVRLTQVMTNLLNNASKYTPQGGAIKLSASVTDTSVNLRVSDNGSGIPAATLPHIFDLFVQSDRALARGQGGLGIGLTVVRRLVEMHGGTVAAYSAGLDHGSEFVVMLPLLVDVPPALVDRAQPRPAHRPRYRIAVIEDNVDANDSVRTLLQMMGNDVFSAFDGLSGVDLVKASVPQVVLCDIGLPGLDGYGVVRRLRDEMDEPLPCMIALTGYGQPKDRANALAAGFDLHLVKPVNPETLMQTIAQYFDPASKKRLPIV